MKTMNCNQLGGACDQVFHANIFQAMVEMSKQHCMEILQKNDNDHLKAMNKMQQHIQEPNAMTQQMHNNLLRIGFYLNLLETEISSR